LLLAGCSSNGAETKAPSAGAPSAGAPSTEVPEPNGGGGTAPTADVDVDVVQVTTLTTVQASSGLFLSASPEQDVPDYVARGELGAAADPMTGLDLAKVDVALLFQSESTADLPDLHAQLRSSGAGQWSPIEHYFPTVEPVEAGADWPIELLRDASQAPTGVSSEWSGWQAYGGLGVRPPQRTGGSAPVSAAVATLDFEVRGRPSPLVLSGDVGNLRVTNRSGSVIARALLIYSHPGGVAVTEVNELGPGASAVTALGPKEHPPAQLLEMARAELRSLFVASVGAELGAAIADAKSIPFLETQGLRLISMLDVSEAPATIDFSATPSRLDQVVVSHSEILKPDEETRVLSVVADETLSAAEVASQLGRFSEAKLQFAASNGDDTVRPRAEQLLVELRSR